MRLAPRKAMFRERQSVLSVEFRSEKKRNESKSICSIEGKEKLNDGYATVLEEITEDNRRKKHKYPELSSGYVNIRVRVLEPSGLSSNCLIKIHSSESWNSPYVYPPFRLE